MTAAAALMAACAQSPPIHMNDYEQLGEAQRLWPFQQQMLMVMPVPAFNLPVHIRDVQLRTVAGSGQFDHPAAFLIRYSNGGFYTGAHLTYALSPDSTEGSKRESLSKSRVHQLDNHLSIVIPVNIHSSGCHEAQIVLRVATEDGHVHALPTRWYVALDTGVTKSQGIHLCTPVSQ